jgi:hypothetical protein
LLGGGELNGKRKFENDDKPFVSHEPKVEEWSGILKK